MKKMNFKSIVALMVLAMATVFVSCSKDESGVFGGLEFDENNNPVGTTYELLSSEHLSMAELSANENVITIPCDHIAHFKSNAGDDTYDRDYDVTNSATIGNSSIATEDITKIINQTYIWENGVFAIGKSFISMTFGETMVSKVKIGNQTFGKDELSYCKIVAAELTLGDATEVEPKKFNVPATIVFTMSCGEDEQVSWDFDLTVIETAEDDQVTEEIKNVKLTEKGIEYDYVVEHTVNTELNSTTHFVEAVDFALQAEERKIFDTEDILSLNNPEPSVNGKDYSFEYNLFVNKLSASYPEEVVLTQGNATYTFTMPVPTVIMNGMKSEKSSDADYDYVNYTINYSMMVSGVNVATVLQEVSTRKVAVKDEVTYYFENIRFTENGVEYDFVEKHSENTELDNSTHHVEKVNFSLTAEAKKTFNTEEALTLTSNTPSVNGKVYSFAWNLFNNRLSAAYPTQVTLSQKGQTHVFNMPTPAVKMMNLSQNAGQNATHNFVEYTIVYVMTVNNIEVASAQQLVRTESLIPVNPTIEGWEIDPEYVGKGAMTDKYNGSREALHHTSICYVFRQVGNTANKMMVEFTESGAEMGRYDVSGLNLNASGFFSMVWNGNTFIPAVMQGVSNTSEKPQAWKYVALDGSAEGQVSPVSVNAHSLRNPLRAIGNTVNGVTTINGIKLK